MIELKGVQPGMDVLDSAGEHLGKVDAIETTWQGGSGLDTSSIDVDAGTTPNTYIKVTNGRTLWIPVNQVVQVESGERVTVACDRQACYDHYDLEPPGLVRDSEPRAQ